MSAPAGRIVWPDPQRCERGPHGDDQAVRTIRRRTADSWWDTHRTARISATGLQGRRQLPFSRLGVDGWRTRFANFRVGSSIPDAFRLA